jgi:hypothetical protein
MNARVFLVFRYLVVVMAINLCSALFSGLSLAEEIVDVKAPMADSDKAQTIGRLSRCQKLIKPEVVLSDFIAGESTIQVIVNIRRPDFESRFQNIRDEMIRKQLHERVREAQNLMISSFDVSQVKINSLFRYVFGFSAEVTLRGLEELVDHSGVASVEKDRVLHAQLAQGIPLIRASIPRTNYNGSGLAIAICDTGIDYTHPMLGGGGFPNSKVIGGYDCGDDDSDPIDQHGHGTGCAGIAAGDLGADGDYIGGVAPGAKLYAIKISTGTSGSASTSNMIEGWEWCITHQHDEPSYPIMMISTSFGGYRYFGTCDSASPATSAAAANTVASGITLFSASGNDGYCDSIGWPACISHVVSVGAVYDGALGRHPPAGYVNCLDISSCSGHPAPPCIEGEEKWSVDESTREDQVCAYSNTATFLDLLAPSNWATSTKLGGGYHDTPNGFGGTSAACPYAAGAAASLQCAAWAITGAYLSPDQLKSIFVRTGEQIKDEKVAISNPRIDLEAAVNWLFNSDANRYVDPLGVCGGNIPCYMTVQAAINAAGNGETIKMLEGNYHEDIALNSSKQITISGGWNPSYTVQTSTSSICSLTRTAGSLIIRKLDICR